MFSGVKSKKLSTIYQHQTKRNKKKVKKNNICDMFKLFYMWIIIIMLVHLAISLRVFAINETSAIDESPNEKKNHPQSILNE